MNTQAYIDITTRIRAEAPAIKDIDIYNRQYEEPAYCETYSYPAVYIEWSANVWNNLNDNSQQGLGGFIIHVVVGLADHNTRNIDTLSGPDQTTALAPFNIFKDVHIALNNWMPSGFITPLERVADEPDHNFPAILVMKYKYTADAIDDDTNVFNNANWQQGQVTDVNDQPAI